MPPLPVQQLLSLPPAPGAPPVPGMPPQPVPGQQPGAYPQAVPGAFPQQQPGYPGYPGQPMFQQMSPYQPPTIPGAGCPPGTVAGKDPGTCFSVDGSGFVSSQYPVDPLQAAMATMHMQQVPKVSVNVNVPSKEAAKEAEKAIDELVLPPVEKKKPPLGLMAAGIAALWLLGK